MKILLAEDTADLNRVITAMLEHEGFLAWYAKEQGWDKKLGFEMDLNIEDVSGVEIINKHNFDPDSWNITAMSSTPLIVAKKNSCFEIIAIANDESSATKIYVKGDSEILKHKGWNHLYPNVYGSPETIAEKKFYVKRLTSSEYVLAKWLEIFDLDLSDVIIIDKDGEASIESMNKGDGEGMSLWSPDTCEAEEQGYDVVTTARMINAEVPLMFVVNKKYASENEDLIARFLAVYLKAVQTQEEGYKQLVKPYQKFMQTYKNKFYPEEFCIHDLKNHAVYELDKQLGFFEKKGHRKSIIHKLERNITSSLVLFLNDINDKMENEQRVRSPRNFTDIYLKQAEPYLRSLNDL